jgi:hypothetical protein
MTSYDHYAAATELISRLTASGHQEAAETLGRSIEGGATATEILMALRFHLKSIIARLPPSSDTALLAQRFLSEINASLAN